jgi:hypothetical protein
MAFISVPEALEEVRAGRQLVIVDDEDRENEGDLMIAAEYATPEAINFMATHGRGLICLAMTGERLDHLRVPLMTERNTSTLGTAFCTDRRRARRYNRHFRVRPRSYDPDRHRSASGPADSQGPHPAALYPQGRCARAGIRRRPG